MFLTQVSRHTLPTRSQGASREDSVQLKDDVLSLPLVECVLEAHDPILCLQSLQLRMVVDLAELSVVQLVTF